MFENSLKITFIFFMTLVSCKQNTEIERFELKKDYLNFSNHMNNSDTLKLDFNLSACSWFEYEQAEITMRNDKFYYQIKERLVWADKDEPIRFPKVEYKLSQDTLNLDVLISSLTTENSENNKIPYLILSNPKEKDSVFLYTRNLTDRIENIEKYNLLLRELYPTEMGSYYSKYPIHEILPVPPIPE